MFAAQDRAWQPISWGMKSCTIAGQDFCREFELWYDSGRVSTRGLVANLSEGAIRAVFLFFLPSTFKVFHLSWPLTLTLLDRALSNFWTVHFYTSVPLERPFLFMGPSTFSRMTIKNATVIGPLIDFDRPHFFETGPAILNESAFFFKSQVRFY